MPQQGNSRKGQAKFWMDLASATALCATIGGGILLRWVLPCCGRGGQGLVWFGRGRQFWIEVHLWSAVLLLALLVVHLCLNWTWIRGWWCRVLHGPASLGSAIVLTLMLTLMLLPLLVSPRRPVRDDAWTPPPNWVLRGER